MSKASYQMRSDDFADPDTAANSINQNVLKPVYARLAALERRQQVEISFKTPTPAGNAFPLFIPNPGFSVKGLTPMYLWNTTANTPEPLPGLPQWQQVGNGSLALQSIPGLSDGQSYVFRCELIG